MEAEATSRLLCYEEVAYVNEAHQVRLVQHRENRKIFVLKTLRIYDMKVFSVLAEKSFRGVPKIVELVEDDGTLHVIEEYVSGNTLEELLLSDGPFSEEDSIEYIDRLCDILRPFHEFDPPIVHRDIKPSNLLVGFDGRLVLIDFNSAKESDYAKSQDTVLIGTVGYAAPEQYGFSAARPATDIYAIGVLLNELLTGRLPTQEKYAGRLESVIKKCIRMDLARRYQKVDQLQRALRGKVKPREEAQEKKSAEREKLPPARPGIIWGLVVFSFGVLFFETARSNAERIDGAFFSLLLLTEILFIVNYRQIWSLFPLSRSTNFLIRGAGVLFWLFALPVLLMAFWLP